MGGQPMQSASFGSWSSPITADTVVADAAPLSEPRIDGEDIYWIEGRPPAGRGVVVRRAANGNVSDVTPEGPFDVRSRVHSYGGGAYIVHEGVVYFVHRADNQIYRQTGTSKGGAEIDWSAPARITSSPACLFADLCVDPGRRRLIAI